MAIQWMNSGALWGADLLQAGLADAEFHLFKSGEGITINPSLILADLEAAEADFTGYVPAVIAAWANPILMPGGGAGVSSPNEIFAIAAPYTVPNTIGGGWCQDATGVLLFAWDYEEPIPVVGAGGAVTVLQIPVFG